MGSHRAGTRREIQREHKTSPSKLNLIASYQITTDQVRIDQLSALGHDATFRGPCHVSALPMGHEGRAGLEGFHLVSPPLGKTSFVGPSALAFGGFTLSGSGEQADVRQEVHFESRRSVAPLPRRAISRLMHRKKDVYSITSLARASSCACASRSAVSAAY